MADRPGVWFERPVLPDLLDEVVASVSILGPGTEAAPLSGIESARGVVAGSLRYDADVMDLAPDLKVISRTGIGVDRVDLGAATERGVAVCNAPDAPTVSTAEHTLALILAVAKRMKDSEERLRAGESDLYARHDAIELSGKTLGLVGFGRIARRVASMTDGLGMSVAFFDPHVVDSTPSADRLDSLMELLTRSDVVSLHVPLTPETVGMIGEKELGAMRERAILINTARGGLVDQDALLEALERAQLFGAGLDVTDPEPLPADHPLLVRSDVVVTPHTASGTWEGKRRLFWGALEQVLQVLSGEEPDNLVNPEVWPTTLDGSTPETDGTRGGSR